MAFVNYRFTIDQVLGKWKELSENSNPAEKELNIINIMLLGIGSYRGESFTIAIYSDTYGTAYRLFHIILEKYTQGDYKTTFLNDSMAFTMTQRNTLSRITNLDEFAETFKDYFIDLNQFLRIDMNNLNKLDIIADSKPPINIIYDRI